MDQMLLVVGSGGLHAYYRIPANYAKGPLIDKAERAKHWDNSYGYDNVFGRHIKSRVSDFYKSWT